MNTIEALSAWITKELDRGRRPEPVRLSASVIKKEISDRLGYPRSDLGVRWGKYQLSVRLTERPNLSEELDRLNKYCQSRRVVWGGRGWIEVRGRRRTHPCPGCDRRVRGRAANLFDTHYSCGRCRIEMDGDGRVISAPKYRSLDA